MLRKNSNAARSCRASGSGSAAQKLRARTAFKACGVRGFLQERMYAMSFKVLAVGDTVGPPGLEYIQRRLRAIKRELEADFVVVNGENANVVGCTPRQADALLDAGADCVTLGNHTWTRWELQPYLDDSIRVIRPANYAPQCPGRGCVSLDTPAGEVLVVNLIGRFTLDPNTDNPFLTADDILGQTGAKIILVDFHAEATSEKLAMGYFLDGRVSAVWGTHTHVQTSDARVLPNGTGYVTDLGMTGPVESVIGIKPEQSIGKFLGDVPRRYECAHGKAKLEGALFTIDEATGRCLETRTVRYL